jgi:hypothetical protein
MGIPKVAIKESPQMQLEIASTVDYKLQIEQYIN